MSVRTLTQLRTEILDSFRAAHAYTTSEGARLAAFLTNLVDSMEALYPLKSLLLSGAGAPVNYTDGDPVATGDGVSPPGGLYIDTTNAVVYRNDGTAAQPLWVALADAA